MATTKKQTAKDTQRQEKAPKGPERVSKTWQAVLANKGAVEILDMKAVLK